MRRVIIYDIKPAPGSIYLCLLLLLSSFSASSQITVTSVQNFNFGSFYQGNSGGTVDVSATGSRTATGDIILMNTVVSGSQAIFEIEAPAGTIISLSCPDATLTGSNGGSLTLHFSNTDPGSPFNTTAVAPDRTRVQMGGTLTVGSRVTSPPGTYQGTFSITFNHE